VIRDKILGRHWKTLIETYNFLNQSEKHCYASSSLVFKWHGRLSDTKGRLEDDLLEGRQYFRDNSAVKMTWLTVKGDKQFVTLPKNVDFQRLHTQKIIPWSKYESCLCSFWEIKILTSDNLKNSFQCSGYKFVSFLYVIELKLFVLRLWWNFAYQWNET
jgi:hypothetical protein